MWKLIRFWDMRVYSAYDWEEREAFIDRKKKEVGNAQIKKKNKEVLRARIAHNAELRQAARLYAKDMKGGPSELEKRMQAFLDSKEVKYNFQKVFYIKNKNNRIIKFYIADFYIPSKQLIIETDGAFHDNQIEEDEARTRSIQKHYPNIKVFRWRWYDFDNPQKVENLMTLLL